jgi:hypothetical protein
MILDIDPGMLARWEKGGSQIADAIVRNNERAIHFASLKESTFDLAFSKSAAASLSKTFRETWNLVCKKQRKMSWSL